MTGALARLACGTLVAALAVGASAGVATSASSPSAKQVAQAGVLLRSDFPAGWTQSARPSTSDSELDKRAAKIASCKPFLAFSKANRKNPRATSPNFDLGQAHVNNTVSVYPSAARATAVMQTFTDPRLPDCLDKLFSAEFTAQLKKNQQVAKQLQSVKVDVARLDGVTIGDEAIAYEGTVAVALKGGTVTNIGLALIAVRVANAVAGYSYTADTDISAALQPAMVTSVSRLQQETAASPTS